MASFDSLQFGSIDKKNRKKKSTQEELEYFGKQVAKRVQFA